MVRRPLVSLFYLNLVSRVLRRGVREGEGRDPVFLTTPGGTVFPLDIGVYFVYAVRRAEERKSPTRRGKWSRRFVHRTSRVDYTRRVET